MSKMLLRCITDARSFKAVLNIWRKPYMVVPTEELWTLACKASQDVTVLHGRYIRIYKNTKIVCGCDICRIAWCPAAKKEFLGSA